MQVAQRLQVSFLSIASQDGSMGVSESGVGVAGTRLHSEDCWRYALAE